MRLRCCTAVVNRPEHNIYSSSGTAVQKCGNTYKTVQQHRYFIVVFFVDLHTGTRPKHACKMTAVNTVINHASFFPTQQEQTMQSGLCVCVRSDSLLLRKPRWDIPLKNTCTKNGVDGKVPTTNDLKREGARHRSLTLTRNARGLFICCT